MANIVIYKANAIAAPGVILKNGTGGGAPALNQHPDWPMRNLLLQDRYSYWRDVGDGNEPILIDFDLGSSQTISALAATIFRHYGTANNDKPGSAFSVLYGASYPPTNYLDESDFDFYNIVNNDNVYAATPTAARYWRFEVMPNVNNGESISCKFWLIKTSDILTITHDWDKTSSIANRRLREELRTPSGLLYTFAPALLVASDVTEADFLLPTATQTEWDTFRGLADLQSRFLISDPNGKIWETSLNEGKISAQRTFYGAYDLALRLEQHP